MKRSRVWIWFFVLVAVLAIAAGITEVWFNLSQQLNPEQVERAIALWGDHAATEFEQEFVLTRQSRQPLNYRAIIRDREIAAVLLDGQEVDSELYPLHDLPPLFEAASAWLAEDPSRVSGEVTHSPEPTVTATYRVKVQPGLVQVSRNGRSIPARLTEAYLPAAQLAAIGRQLELDRRPETGRLFCVATFDRNNGMPIRYVRSVTATRERVQIAVMNRKLP